MTTSETYRNRISPLSIIVQLITLGVLFATWRSGYHLVAIPCVLILLFMLFVLPRLIGAVERRFQREALRLLTTNRAADVVSLARGQILLQLFGAAAPVDARLGMALCELERYSEAIPCLDNAIPRAPAGETPALMAALTRALFASGNPKRAEIEGRILLEKTGLQIGEPAILVSRARMGLGRRDPATIDYLKTARRLSLNSDEQLMLTLTEIEWDLLHDRKCDEVPADADSARQFLRVWIHYVRAEIKESRGQIEDALKHYARAAALADKNRIWFADLSRERVASLGKDHVRAAQESIDADSARREAGETDAHLKRKKKRR